MKPPSRHHPPCVVKLWSLAFKIQDQRLKLSTIHPSWCVPSIPGIERSLFTIY
ncbi:hypothetical protein RchiOBHm_Chr1g0342521 [Rosa chinensis]|uniref:Uncharacterized protein n=1 Tax=Rosa chinensis TaxID=74649 RepID=A0A2P6SE15_ROSCH|nr:hypothetical protein RchiOBHm_Chr1g0342521 [Rosa chinensis]